ncbi:ribosome-binding factor A [Breznakia sp. PF5-3]|uniref:30S ribosome-binding factor RbfA n=1 Tax=unclassified Breznakia TaxID=2623764 RepID=UPI00240526D1|nr:MULTISPECIES: 30S ribosome-binding factor RbfA [unclassified Breznakia]MDF9824072.1 ribosome-binding factor A [Breznakia sp. PM6-1]MDF9834862.1 ribosome-binding factor A [Breznakia sp. PF5-3]MDF9837116.1 ribosome-binding factor A [Breznakia sp. PFB2-8]MDF9859041.1 ribosome-binding factor A [Breznakia sp. PH5-24]
MGLKNEKVAELIRRNISEIITRAVKDPKIGFITVMDCVVTNDLSVAKVYVSFLGRDSRKEAGMKALNRSKGFIRSELSKKLTMRKVPELVFLLDDTLEKGDRIDKIIADIHARDK